MLTERAKVKEHPRESRRAAPSVGNRLKYTAYYTLTVADRLIGSLSSLYENIFGSDKVIKAGFYKEEGFRYFDKEEYQKAVDSFIEYLEKGDKEDIDVLYYLGISYAKVNEREKALFFLKKAEEIEGGDADIIPEIGSCLAELGRWPQAIDYYKKAVELTPDAAAHYHMLGICYEKAGRLDESLIEHKKSAELNPKEPLYHNALGFVLESAKRHAEAIACFRKAMELGRCERRDSKR